MAKKTGLAVVAAAALVTGCSTSYEAATPEKVSHAVTIKDSEYDRGTTFGGPVLHKDRQRGLFRDNIAYGLGVSKDKATQKARYFLWVHVLYIGDWRLYQSISLKGGTILTAKTTSQDVNFCGVGCSHTEEFVVELPGSLVSTAADNGIQFRINAKNGADEELTLSSDYVTGILTAVSKRKVS